MKRFLTVLGFELNNYFKNKSYILTTAIISIVLIVGLSVPSFVDLSGFIPGIGNKQEVSENTDEVNKEKDEKIDEKDIDKYYILDENNILGETGTEVLTNAFMYSEWTKANSEKELKEKVEKGEAHYGFVIKNATEYVYYVNNKDIHDSNEEIFNEILQSYYRQNALSNEGIDSAKVQEIYDTKINAETHVLGKDSRKNYFYAYILIFVMYMMILLYGQLVAVSVTSEKSSRAIEVLVTSTSSNSLIFGKVFAAAIASIVQVGVILASGVVTYNLNGKVWNGLLDGVFAIPANILVTFAIFGGIGYIFYAFIFAALGALVSKTEDISKSIGNITFIFIIVFFISIYGLQNSDGMLIRIASFVPFSSCMTMIIRVAMGSVKNIEIVISAAILIISTILTGIGSAKIYRMGTLRYGNPIKLKNALKWLKKEKK